MYGLLRSLIADSKCKLADFGVYKDGVLRDVNKSLFAPYININGIVNIFTQHKDVNENGRFYMKLWVCISNTKQIQQHYKQNPNILYVHTRNATKNLSLKIYVFSRIHRVNYLSFQNG